MRNDIERASDFAAVQNHDSIPDDNRRHQPLASISVPTLVIHGTADPMFPIDHGEALANEIRGANLVRIEGGGHGIERTDWEMISRAILEHTGGCDGEGGI